MSGGGEDILYIGSWGKIYLQVNLGQIPRRSEDINYLDKKEKYI